MTASPAVLMCRQSGTSGKVRRCILAGLECLEYLGSACSKMCVSVTFATKCITFSLGQVGKRQFLHEEESASFFMRLGCKQDAVHCIS